MADPRIPDAALPDSAASQAMTLLGAAPNATYHIVERVKGDPSVELCRVGGEGARGRECVQIAQDVTKVFAFMQKQGFFCQLPFDPTHTEIECVRINKIVERQS
ncbi:hypothetical protein JCM10450v2_000968 [Rhodotorula kratochvilovae]